MRRTMFCLLPERFWRQVCLLLIALASLFGGGCRCIIILPTAEFLPCDFEVTPGRINYGTVPVGGEVRQVLLVKNVSNRSCPISELDVVSVQPASSSAFRLGGAVRLPMKLGFQQTVAISILFAPKRYNQTFLAQLVMNKSDKSPLRQEVELQGDTRGSCLEVSPNPVVFGDRIASCGPNEKEVLLRHIGAPGCPNPIIVSAAMFAPKTSSEFQFSKTVNLPIVLRPGESSALAIQYEPFDRGVDQGELRLFTLRNGDVPIRVVLQGRGFLRPSQRDTFRAKKGRKVDLLFVVDNSCSMQQEQQGLGENFGSFMRWASRLDADFQIGVVSTDVDSKNAGCLQGETKIITSQTPDPVNTFWDNVILGTNGSSAEKGLESAYLALIEPNASGCNRGFVRKDAGLSLVFISDEGDQSENSVGFYVNLFRLLKGGLPVNASAVVGPVPDGCKSPTGDAGPAKRYLQVAKMLGGVTASICDARWSKTLTQLAFASFGTYPAFKLSKDPILATILVKVDQKPVPQSSENGWSYDVKENQIVFSGTAIPTYPSTVLVDYQVSCESSSTEP